MEIAPEKARIFAQAFLKNAQATIAEVPVGFPRLTDAACGSKQVEIFDISGPRLFYDFPLLDNHGALNGSVRVAADTIVGHPFVAIQTETTHLRSLRNAEQAAERRVAEEYPGTALESSQLVCFNYPRLGLRLTIRKPSGERLIRIFDLEFPASRLLAAPEGGASRIEGDTALSFLAALPEGGDPSPLFTHADELVTGLLKEGARRLAILDFDPSVADQQQMSAILDSGMSNQPEGIGAPREKLIQVPLLPQKEPDYCVIACISMLLRFYGVPQYAEQDDVRKRLQESPPLYQSGGVLPEHQAEAFDRCFPSEHFRVDMDNTPSWQHAFEDIEAGRPFKSGIYGHARVAVGYREAALTTTGQVLLPEWQRCLWINDPNSSNVRLELYEVVTQDDATHEKKTRPAIPIKYNAVVVRRI